MSPGTDTPESSDGPLETGLRAARLRCGYTQERLAELVNVSLSTYRKWDRGGRPADPRKAQALAAATRTPIHVLWPPASDPAVATALDAVRVQQDLEDAQARDLKDHQDATAGLSEPAEATWTPPATPTPTPGPGSAPVSSYGLHRQIEATNRDLDRNAPGARRPGRKRRVLIPAAASIAVIAAAGTAIATTNSDVTPASQTARTVQVGPTAAQRERTAQQATLVGARDRGDYDAAITAATSLNDTSTVAELRTTAGDVLARRARQAAERGDLPLATLRLDRAEDRYGDSPTIRGVRARIEQIKDARRERAAQRRRAAKQRTAARARAAAAARQAAPSRSSPAPGGSSASPAPSLPVPSSPSPAPRPAPAPSAGGSGGSSGGESSSGGGSKGGGSSSGGAVDPGLF